MTVTPRRQQPPPSPAMRTAIVIDNLDPLALARVRLRFGDLPDPTTDRWARVATLAAGAGHGSLFVPAVGDEVLVAFENGDPERLCVIGSLWSAAQPPPPANAASQQVLRTQGGLTVMLDDAGRQLRLGTDGGQSLTISDAPAGIVLADANGNSIVVHAGGITITSAASVTVNAGLVQFSGAVKCDTLIANSVVAASYTPGAGNIA